MAIGAFASVPNLNSVPSAKPMTLATNYIDFTSGDTNGWAQQYLPDLIEQEAEVFGNRTIGGFLEMVGAEMPMTSDQVIWSEQGRLHLSYVGNIARVGSTAVYEFTMLEDIDGNSTTTTANDTDWGSTAAPHGVRVGDLVVLADGDGTVKGYVTTVGTSADLDSGSDLLFAPKITVACLTDAGTGLADVTASGTNKTGSLFVFGSSYGKGTEGRASSIQPQFKSFTNRPMIIKDKYEISGSDASQIGWVEVSGEGGQSGYLWYLKSEGDTRVRFADYLEMTMLETEKATQTITGHRSDTIAGTEGLFAAIEDRGNIFDGLNGDTTNFTAALGLADFDKIVKEFDKQGAIEEYMIFGDRQLMLTIDDTLAGQYKSGSAGTSYGVFENDENMALNLGFSGFRRGSYDFYKTPLKYFNDKATRGGIKDVVNHIGGLFIPAGVTSVYDEQLGRNLKRPFLHVRYRASQMEDRRFKTWTTGSVGAATKDLDAMEMHYLSERCLVVQGANNFLMIKGSADYS